MIKKLKIVVNKMNEMEDVINNIKCKNDIKLIIVEKYVDDYTCCSLVKINNVNFEFWGYNNFDFLYNYKNSNKLFNEFKNNMFACIDQIKLNFEFYIMNDYRLNDINVKQLLPI